MLALLDPKMLNARKQEQTNFNIISAAKATNYVIFVFDYQNRRKFIYNYLETLSYSIY